MADELPQLDGVEHRFVDVDGVRIHLATAGRGDSGKPPVLLLHGWPQHWYMWRVVIAELRDEFRLLAPDLRGFGWSDAPGDGYDPQTFAADQIALLDALGIERAFVVGHDWGGFTALLLGIGHPERVERVVALNAPHPWPRIRPRLALELWRSWYALAMAVPGVGRLALQRGLAANILRRGNVHDPFGRDEIETYLRRLQEPARSRATAALYRYYERAFLRAGRGGWRSHRLTVPALLVFGERDRYVSKHLLPGYEPYADDMRVELVPDSGHFIVNEKPELVVERIREFLAG